MTQWFSKLFGHGSTDGGPERAPDERTPHSSASEKDARTVEMAAARRNDARTQPVDRTRAARLSWPARDESSSPESQAERAAPNGHWRGNEDLHEAPTRLVGSSADRSRPEELRSSSPTRGQDGRSPIRRNASPEPADDTTRLVAPAETEPNDPVVGWLVVMQGPGRGRSLEIGTGANTIGRAQSQKLRLDFGDARISRERHAVLVFDPRARRFFLQNGEVRNLTYVGDDVVLAPVELDGGETITIGETQVRFVAFCGPQFGWS